MILPSQVNSTQRSLSLDRDFSDPSLGLNTEICVSVAPKEREILKPFGVKRHSKGIGSSLCFTSRIFHKR